ncbi:MAG: 4Fe-4S dicluster domain-containing protein [Proteobacteria bacterium]|nr:4Fe-4S dicluster domain-containing protein [Pseudomonadota bacterium]
MSAEPPNAETPNSTGVARRVFWSSLDQKSNPRPATDAEGQSDAPKAAIDAAELLRVNRRGFLTLTGAISALAAEGCIRRPVEKILPYSRSPEYAVPGVPRSYATVTERRGEALGLIVRSHEGRPTKVEGNPEHPGTAGATDLWAQASILQLYDADRSRSPVRDGAAASVADFDAFVRVQLEAAQASAGEGLRILAEPSNSPTLLRLRDSVMRRLPKARFHTYTPVNESQVREGARIAFGTPVATRYAYDKADVVLSLDSDFLTTEAGAVAALRGFGRGRKIGSAHGSLNRLYVVESRLSCTGASADHRLRLAAGDVQRYAKLLAAELAASHGIALGEVADAASGASKDGIPAEWIRQVAAELASHRGRSLIVAGSGQPPAVHALVHVLNASLSNVGQTVRYFPVTDAAEPEQFADLAALTSDMAAGAVKTLFILGGNPCYDAPADLEFAGKLAKVPASAHLCGWRNETSMRCTWHMPRTHELEAWGDQRASDGTYSVQQPLIAPLHGGRSNIELLAGLAGAAATDGYSAVRATLSDRGLGGESAWFRTLHRGLVANSATAPLRLVPRGADTALALQQLPARKPPSRDNLEVVFAADSRMLDGRFANNAWLQELPDPITRITWDNAATLSPATAAELGVRNGAVIQLSQGDRVIEIAAWIVPGHANNSITLPLGWGRSHAGRFGNGTGFDVYPLRTSTAPHFTDGVRLKVSGRMHAIAQTQEHDSMEGRPVVIDGTLEAYKDKPNFPQYESPIPSVAPLWPTVDYSKGNQWAMNIDLTRCVGCAACVMACQAENNIPVVGKDDVARGREMSWLRIDRYYVGDEHDPEVAFQPLACQHCEEAPCENVCPVNATSHTPSGLNDIAYNRCIGTRYCMNNCPYKVRRFNFRNYNLAIPETERMQKNPNVTVRFRGVVEKCSYCVQRIQDVTIRAKREHRTIAEGEIRTACQQACPAEAIVFGDRNLPGGQLAALDQVDRRYKLLADIGTRPRTTYLAKIRNPNPNMGTGTASAKPETHG